MSNNDFHKSMSEYLDVKRNGPRTKASRRAERKREPIIPIIRARVRQILRKLRILRKRLKAFFSADHELDLNSLHQDVFVIERDEKRSTVFWRQFKTLFQTATLQKKAPTTMTNHLYDKKERAKNHHLSKATQPEDIDAETIRKTIENNAL